MATLGRRWTEHVGFDYGDGSCGCQRYDLTERGPLAGIAVSF